VKIGRGDMHTVGPGVLGENSKMLTMRHKHCMTCKMARNTEKDGK
jgi:hypothetical protein